MKFNVNPKELLALHNLLHERYTSGRVLYKEDGERDADDVQLYQVYNRLRALLVASLSNKQVDDPLDTFMQREQAKIDNLKEGIVDVEAARARLLADLKVPGPVPSIDHDPGFEVTDYPRRSSRKGGHLRGNTKR